MEQEEGELEGGAGAEWRQSAQEDMPEGKGDLWGPGEEAADWMTGKASVGWVTEGTLHQGTQQQGRRSESRN